VIRFLERRFGVLEPNITPWRRAVCGDLTSAFNFSRLDDGAFFENLPDTTALAARARKLGDTTTPPTPAQVSLPRQERGVRPSRALPYELHVVARLALEPARVELAFVNSGAAAAVFHVYDRRHLDRLPRRYTVEAKRHLAGVWELGADQGAYDLWVLGPNGFHRHFTGVVTLRGRAPEPEVELRYLPLLGSVSAQLRNRGPAPCRFVISANAYERGRSWTALVGPHAAEEQHWPLRQSGYWYDLTVRVDSLPGFSRRFAGRLETGRDSFSDPAMGGAALGDQEPSD
jgi:phospholipase C